MQRASSFDQFDEVLLWLSVLEAGIQDHLVGVDCRWIHSGDFDLICMFCNLDADILRAGILALDFEVWADRQVKFNGVSRRPTFAGIQKWCYTFSPKRSAA